MPQKTSSTKRRKYDADFKAEVLKMVASGKPVTEISQALVELTKRVVMVLMYVGQFGVGHPTKSMNIPAGNIALSFGAAPMPPGYLQSFFRYP